MPKMKISSKVSAGDDERALFVAEEGQANQGQAKIAMEMCSLAAKAGADGIEFQFFLADDMYIARDKGHQIYKSRELSETEVREIVSEAHSQGLFCQVAGLSSKMIEIAAHAGADVFVVNASDLSNPTIIDAVSSTGKPLWLATLMATVEEIDWAVEYAQSRSKSDIGILHGQHVMSSSNGGGVPPELLQLDCIQSLRRRYGLPTGFVDHTSTVLVPALAVAKGAALVTKHLAPTAAWSGPDSEIALAPDRWRIARDFLEYAALANGASKELSQAEVSDRSHHRRSVYTRRILRRGHVLTCDDIQALRPGAGGIDPRFSKSLIGRTLAKDLGDQHQLQPSDFV